MNRVAWFIICTVVGLELIAWGLLVPVHVRTVDARVLELKGAPGPSLTDEGWALLKAEKTGPARMLWMAARGASVPGHEELGAALRAKEESEPRLRVWGGPALYLETILARRAPGTNTQAEPLIDLLVPETARRTVREALREAPRPGVLEVLQTRELTNTLLFPPALSSAGQPLDATITLTALLFQQSQFSPGLRKSIESLAQTANKGGDVQPLEAVYLDVLGLGRRLSWGQLDELLKRIPGRLELEQAAVMIRERARELPVVYASIHFAENAGAVAQYLDSFPGTGMKDLRFAVRAGAGAVRDLLRRQQPVHYPEVREKLTRFRLIRAAYTPMAGIATQYPRSAFVLKYGLCVLGVLLLARAAMYLSPALAAEMEATRAWVGGPQVAIALGLLFLLLFFTESLATRASQATEFPLRVKIPVARTSLPARMTSEVRPMIDKFSLVSLLTFFVMQVVIYVVCRMKLAEIRRQTLPSRLKLRLLENEEHLFDAGLYFGFVGTVASLIFVSLGIIKPSLMAAYSSTSFGIIFVSILKIFYVRPYRRRLILDAEIADRQPQAA